MGGAARVCARQPQAHSALWLPLCLNSESSYSSLRTAHWYVCAVPTRHGHKCPRQFAHQRADLRRPEPVDPWMSSPPSAISTRGEQPRSFLAPGLQEKPVSPPDCFLPFQFYSRARRLQKPLPHPRSQPHYWWTSKSGVDSQTSRHPKIYRALHPPVLAHSDDTIYSKPNLHSDSAYQIHRCTEPRTNRHPCWCTLRTLHQEAIALPVLSQPTALWCLHG
mmetsp:Transcript_50838/g.95340  ORF Transcript_50838/g.95340 Transcript_50838/m.95340 type:complete len:220 (-) Transcript_50838:241-900(-)